MPCKMRFSDFLKFRNFQNGKVGDDGKPLSIFLDIIIGPFRLKNINYLPPLPGKQASIHLNQGKNLTVKPAYIRVLAPLIYRAYLADAKQKGTQ